MSCPTTSAQAYENCGAPALNLQSYGAIGNGRVAGWIATAVAQSKPAGAPSSYATVCEAMLRARGLIYYKTNPGDCGDPQAVNSFGTPQIVGLSGSGASGVVSGLGAAGVIGGAATLGISAAVSVGVGAIESIFAHHTQAVANEQATICAVMNYFNPLVAKIDAAVRSGTITPDAGSAYLTQVCNSAKNGLAGIMKACNASCVYQAICQAHIYFAANFYPAIAPPTVGPQAPGTSPNAWGTLPGGVTANGNIPPPAPPLRSTPGNTYASSIPSPTSPGSSTTVINPTTLTTPNAQPVTTYGSSNWLEQGYNQQTGQSAQAADVAPSSINWTMVGAVIAVITLLVLVSRG